jgi:hypothetical protein
MYEQVKYPRHKDIDEMGREECDGGMVFGGEWEYNLEVVPNKYTFTCNKCYRRMVCDGEEAALYVIGITVQDKLSL